MPPSAADRPATGAARATGVPRAAGVPRVAARAARTREARTARGPRRAPRGRRPIIGRGSAAALALLAILLIALGSGHAIQDAWNYSHSDDCPTTAVTSDCRSYGSAVVIGHRVISNFGPDALNLRISNTAIKNDAAWLHIADRTAYNTLTNGTTVRWTSWSGRFVDLRQGARSFEVADNPGYRLRRTLPLSVAFLVVVLGALAMVFERGRRSVIGIPLVSGGVLGLVIGYFLPGPHPWFVALIIVGGAALGIVVPRLPAVQRQWHRIRPVRKAPVPDLPAYDPRPALAEISAAAERLLGSVRRLTPAQLRGPSLLAGWTRGDVVTHIARNADGLVNLLTWARTGEPTPQYVSAAAREADIAAGAQRPVGAQVKDLVDSGQRFATAAADLPVAAWDADVAWLSGEVRPARAVLFARLREIEIHHVDLGLGYVPASWPRAFVTRTLAEVVDAYPPGAMPSRLRATDTGFTRTLGEGPTISGPSRDLLAWLLGRGDGSGLSSNPDGPLPTPPRWETAPPGRRDDLDDAYAEQATD